MKRLLIIVLPFLLIVGCSKSINEETLIDKDGLKYHPETIELYSGKVFQDQMGNNQEFEGSYKAGKKDGLIIWWYENGHKNCEGTYINGKQIGLWTLWYENGQKMWEQTFKNGKSISSKEWYINGSFKG